MTYPVDMTVEPHVSAFFDEATNTISYIVSEPDGDHCAIIDSVMDIDYAAGRITFDSADAIIAEVHTKAEAIRQWRLEQYSRTNFDYATEGKHAIPAGTPPTNQIWTGKGYQLIGAAMGAQFHGKNASVRTCTVDGRDHPLLYFQKVSGSYVCELRSAPMNIF